MTEPEARRIAEGICDSMDAEHEIWLDQDRFANIERADWIEQITAALLEASRGKP